LRFVHMNGKAIPKSVECTTFGVLKVGGLSRALPECLFLGGGRWPGWIHPRVGGLFSSTNQFCAVSSHDFQWNQRWPDPNYLVQAIAVRLEHWRRLSPRRKLRPTGHIRIATRENLFIFVPPNLHSVVFFERSIFRNAQSTSRIGRNVYGSSNLGSTLKVQEQQ